MADSAQTQGGDLAGTPLYMAPEQLQGQPELIDWRTDVYALGMTLYEAVTGAPLFTGPTPITVMLRILEGRDPARRRPGRPRDLQAIILKCVAKQPRDRYSTMRDLADDLRRFQDGKPVLARPVPSRSGASADPAQPGAGRRHRRRPRAGRNADGALGGVHPPRPRAGHSLPAVRRAGFHHRAHPRDIPMMPLHDTYQEHPQIRERMRWIRHEMDRLGEIAAGPGHYALGCGSMALDDWDGARSHFEAALRASPNDAASHFNLSVALSEIYRLRRTEALSSGDKFEQGTRLRQPPGDSGAGAAHIRLGVEAAGGDRDYGEALIAKHELDYTAIRLAATSEKQAAVLSGRDPAGLSYWTAAGQGPEG